MIFEQVDGFTAIHHRFIHATTQQIEHLVSGFHSHIGLQQQGFDVIERGLRERVITKVFQQGGDEVLAGLLHAAPQAAQPIDLFQRNLISLASLSGQHLRRPQEILIKLAQLGFGLRLTDLDQLGFGFR